jgi:hypothetical protein
MQVAFSRRTDPLIGDAIWPGFVPEDQEEYFQNIPNHYPIIRINWFLKSRLPAVKSAVATIESRHSKKPDERVLAGERHLLVVVAEGELLREIVGQLIERLCLGIFFESSRKWRRQGGRIGDTVGGRGIGAVDSCQQ